MTMSEQLPPELFQAVLDNPHEFEPRERCAAWFDAHADLWGEYIHLSLAEARSPERFAGGGDDSRKRELERLHGARWSARISQLVDEMDFSRGFIGYVCLNARDFLERAPEIFATAPIRFARLKDVGQVAVELFSSPFLARLVSLGLDRLDDDDGVAALAASPHVRNLRYLAINRGLTGGRVEAVAASENLPVLEVFSATCEPSIAEDYDYDVWDKCFYREPTASPFAKELEAKYGHKPWLHFVERFRVLLKSGGVPSYALPVLTRAWF